MILRSIFFSGKNSDSISRFEEDDTQIRLVLRGQIAEWLNDFLDFGWEIFVDVAISDILSKEDDMFWDELILDEVLFDWFYDESSDINNLFLLHFLKGRSTIEFSHISVERSDQSNDLQLFTSHEYSLDTCTDYHCFFWKTIGRRSNPHCSTTLHSHLTHYGATSQTQLSIFYSLLSDILRLDLFLKCT